MYCTALEIKKERKEEILFLLNEYCGLLGPLLGLLIFSLDLYITINYDTSMNLRKLKYHQNLIAAQITHSTDLNILMFNNKCSGTVQVHEQIGFMKQ